MLLIVGLGPLCPTLPSADQQGERARQVFQLMRDRLSFMRDIAAYKYLENLPIEDKAREQVVIERAERHAVQVHLDPQSIRRLFQAQIEVAKEIQRAYIVQWEGAGTDPGIFPKELATEVRPELMALADKLIQSLAAYVHNGGMFGKELEAEFNKMLMLNHVSAESRRKLANVLRNVRKADR